MDVDVDVIVNAFVHVCVFLCIHASLHACVDVHSCVHVRVCVDVGICAYLCICCMCVCISMRVRSVCLHTLSIHMHRSIHDCALYLCVCIPYRRMIPHSPLNQPIHHSRLRSPIWINFSFLPACLLPLSSPPSPPYATLCHLLVVRSVGMSGELR